MAASEFSTPVQWRWWQRLAEKLGGKNLWLRAAISSANSRLGIKTLAQGPPELQGWFREAEDSGATRSLY